MKRLNQIKNTVHQNNEILQKVQRMIDWYFEDLSQLKTSNNENNSPTQASNNFAKEQRSSSRFSVN